jgi:hypothetical protein
MKRQLIIFISLGLLITGCTKNISSINSDPKNPTTGVDNAVFLQGEKNLADAYTSTSVGSAPFRVLAQSWTENTYVFEAQYNFAPYQAPDGWWNNLYVAVLKNLYQAKNLFNQQVINDPVTLRNDLIVTDILEIYTYNLLAATYGNIPYTQAETDSIPYPKYDDAKTIYTDLLLRLDSCIAGINISGNAMGSADQIYGGNPVQWKKFAATLELKIAMLLADEDPTTALAKTQSAITAGVFQSNDDNALFHYDKSSSGNSNPIWQALVQSGRHDFVPCDLIVNTMDSLNDPRLSLYFTNYPAGNNTYSGGVPGGGNGYGAYSDFSAQLQQPDYSADLLDYSQTAFLLAEAAARGIPVGGSAASNYNNAITASIEFWGGTAAQAATYLAQPTVNYATAGTNWRELIGYQQWIAFYNGNWDAWTIIRHLGFPDIDLINPPVSANGNLPLRLTYPINEQNSNPVNWGGASKLLPGGIDALSAKLFWEQ